MSLISDYCEKYAAEIHVAISHNQPGNTGWESKSLASLNPTDRLRWITFFEQKFTGIGDDVPYRIITPPLEDRES